MSYHSQHEFDRDFQKFKEEVNENTKELLEKVQEERAIELELGELDKKEASDKIKLAHLKPEIRKLEEEKRKIHANLQHMEQENRQSLNEHSSGRNSLIRPLNH